jgi:hypothetical protein
MWLFCPLPHASVNQRSSFTCKSIATLLNSSNFSSCHLIIYSRLIFLPGGLFDIELPGQIHRYMYRRFPLELDVTDRRCQNDKINNFLPRPEKVPRS